MSLIDYIVKALRPHIFCEDGIFLLFLSNTDIYSKSFTVDNRRDTPYDIIITPRFQKDLFNLLNHDGFYFFTKPAENNVELRGLEYIYYSGFCVVKKGNGPYWKISFAPQGAKHNEFSEIITVDHTPSSENTPLILRNFGINFNVEPYCRPFEILNHPRIISDLCRELGVETYLELGVRACPVPGLLKNNVKKIVGVDTVSITDFPGEFWNMSTDDYFNTLRKKEEEGDDTSFDMIFIDACHDYDQVKKDFSNSLRYVKLGGTILLHDTYPAMEYMTASKWCSDAYKIVEYIKNLGLRVLTLPVSPGLSVVQI